MNCTLPPGHAAPSSGAPAKFPFFCVASEMRGSPVVLTLRINPSVSVDIQCAALKLLCFRNPCDAGSTSPSTGEMSVVFFFPLKSDVKRLGE